MRYSWTQYAIGVAVGVVAIVLLGMSLLDYEAALLLLLCARELLRQEPRKPTFQATLPSSATDRDEWRAYGLDVLRALRIVVRVSLFAAAVFLFVYLCARLTGVPSDRVFIALLAVAMVAYPIYAFLQGRSRNEMEGGAR